MYQLCNVTCNNARPHVLKEERHKLSREKAELDALRRELEEERQHFEQDSGIGSRTDTASVRMMMSPELGVWGFAVRELKVERSLPGRAGHLWLFGIVKIMKSAIFWHLLLSESDLGYLVLSHAQK